MPSLKSALAQINKPVSWLKKPRDYEGYIGIGIKLVLFALFLPLFVLAWVVAYELLSQAVQFDLFSWCATEGEAPKPESEPNEPSFGFAALIATILGAPFIIWRSWVAHQDYKVKEQGHITDRINKAVENLGAHKTNKDRETIPNLEVRIGGILALERIAQDSLRDHIQIMEILSAYIRKNAPVSAALSAEELHDNPFTAPRVDVQTALTVIGRRKKQQIKLEEKANYWINLNDTCLQGAVLERLNFSGVRLSFSNLFNARFIETSLIGGKDEKADIFGANLNYTFWMRSSIKNLDFPNSKMLNIDFSESSFQNVVFSSDCIIKSEDIFKNIFLNKTFGDASVILPEGMDRPKHWPNCILGDKFEAEYKKWLEDPKSYTPPNA